MRIAILLALVAVGVALGLWHLWSAAHAIFVFREGEPLWSWLFILAGPGATLVCVIIAAWRQAAGGCLLIAIAVTSTLVLAVASRNVEVIVADLLRITIPMVALGLAFVYVGVRYPRHPITASKVTDGA